MSGKWANLSILRWAREQAAYEPEEVAKSLDISLETLRAWEKDLKHPDIDAIRQLSLLRNLPFSYFFLEVPPEEPPVGDYRGVPRERRAKLSRETQLALREFRRLSRLARTLQEVTGPSILLEIGKAYRNENREQVAKREAKKLGKEDRHVADFGDPGICPKLRS